MFRLQSLLIEKTGFQIDIPSCDGGTSTTGNVARICFLDERDFITWATSTILPEDKPGVIYIHKHLSIILRVYGSSKQIDTNKLDTLCKDLYEYIITKFPWANITPSVHKILAHSAEIITDFNNGYGLKDLSEECLESMNKHARRYREKLSRKTSFEENIKDIFIRLLSQSDPVLVHYRKTSDKVMRKTNEISDQDLIVKSLILEPLSSEEIANL